MTQRSQLVDREFFKALADDAGPGGEKRAKHFALDGEALRNYQPKLRSGETPGEKLTKELGESTLKNCFKDKRPRPDEYTLMVLAAALNLTFLHFRKPDPGIRGWMLMEGTDRNDLRDLPDDLRNLKKEVVVTNDSVRISDWLHLFETQAQADDFILQALRERKKNKKPRPNCITIVAHSLHRVKSFVIDKLVHEELSDRVKLVIGSALQAMQTGSQRQASLIDTFHDTLNREYDKEATDNARKVGLEIVRNRLPPSIKGMRIDDDILCLGWYAWYPTFVRDGVVPAKSAAFVAQMKKELEGEIDGKPSAAKRGDWPSTSDELTLNGHGNPHLVVVNDGSSDAQKAFSILLWMFDYFVRFSETYYEQNTEDLAFFPIDAPDPLLGANNRMTYEEAVKKAVTARAALSQGNP